MNAMEHRCLADLIAAAGDGSQKRAADALGISEGSVSNWRAKGVPVARWDSIRQLFGWSPEEFARSLSWAELAAGLDAGYFGGDPALLGVLREIVAMVLAAQADQPESARHQAIVEALMRALPVQPKGEIGRKSGTSEVLPPKASHHG